MNAAWYEKQGNAGEVLEVGSMPDPEPGTDEVRIRVVASGVNPGDVKKRHDAFGVGMPFPRVIPHSDGAGVIDRVGKGIPVARVGERVWCYGAQTYRPFGTAAQYVVVPSTQAVPLPAGVSFEQGACLGIPGITAHRAVHLADAVAGRAVLVQGGAGAVGSCAVALARQAGARVIATVRSDADAVVATRAGAHGVVRTSGLATAEVVRRLRAAAPDGIDHIVEVAFAANIAVDAEVLAMGGSIATYASGDPSPTIPFWPLAFKNARLYFIGSDDIPADAKVAAARAVNAALTAGWAGFEIDASFPLSAVAQSHELLESGRAKGRVVVTM
jgi:NADPH:quinone reductase